MLGFGAAVSVLLFLGQAPANSDRARLADTAHARQAAAAALYQKRFLVRAPGNQDVSVDAQQEPARRPRVIWQPQTGVQRGPCGMPIIAADPSVDPKMVVEIPEEVKRASKIRVIDLGDCRHRK